MRRALNRRLPIEREATLSQRIDKWLWHARMVRTRTAAAALVSAGHVRVNSTRTTAAGHLVRRGDVVTLALDQSVQIVEVVGFSERRGDAEAGRRLYKVRTP